MKVVIDGNIGSGKTTQLDLLEKKGWDIQKEPLHTWPLKEFYEDQSRWAFYFHMVLLQTLRPKRTDHTVIYERSLMSSRYVFWPVLLKNQVVTRMEDETYAEFYEMYQWFPDVYIFLSKTPEKCHEHIQSRHQTGDSKVSLHYLKDLDREYRQLIRNVPCKVIVVDAERPVEKIHEEICRHLSKYELLSPDEKRLQVQSEGGRRRQVSCSPFENVCRVS